MEKDYEIKKARVTLLGYTQTINGEGPEAIVAAAAKLCYSKVGVNEIMEKSTDEENAKFISMLSSLSHMSPFEHASFTFGIDGISRACSHQIVRHRTGKYSQQSQRYVDLTEHTQFIMPPAIEKVERIKELYIKSILNNFDAYKEIVDELLIEYVKENPNATKKEINLLKKQALEDGRSTLPNACETKMVMTIDARNLLNFLKERLCTRAQWEIREVAIQMLDSVLEVAPNIFSKAGASCVFGACKEGTMSCGIKQDERPLQRKRTK